MAEPVEVTSPTPWGGVPAARALVGATGAVLLAYLVWTLPGVRPGPEFQPALDGALQGAGYVLAALLAVLGCGRYAPRSVSGRLVVASVMLRAVGFVLFLGATSLSVALPYPSVADAAWVLSSLVLLAGLSLRLAGLAPRLPLLVVLDAVASGLAALGLAVLLLAGPVNELNPPGSPQAAVVVNVTYPVLDAALLAAVAAMLATVGRRMTRSDVVLVLGVVGFVVVDVAYFVLLAEGRWRPGTLLSWLSLATTVLIATSPWLRRPSPAPRPRRVGERPTPAPAAGAEAPAAIVAFCLVALVVASWFDLSDPAEIIWSIAIAVAVGRGLLTLRGHREVAGQALGEATIDLGRFQALVEATDDLIGMADHRGQLLYLNPGGRRLLGLPDDHDVTTLSVGDIVPGAGASAFAERWPQVLARGQWTGEAQLEPVDGRPPVPVAISSFVIQPEHAGRPPVLATIQRDISNRIANENAVRDLADQRARLLSRLVQAQEDERSRIAADVHDDSVQALAVVDLRLGTLRRRLSAQDPDLLPALDAVHESVVMATQRLRHLLFDLEGPARESGLTAALEDAAGFVFGETDVDWQVSGDAALDVPEAERVTAYRIAMEAMVNARKHADPRCVEIEVERADGELVVVVRDDGAGIRPGDDEERPGHLGLASMRDRAEVAGGRLEVRRRTDGGTGGGTEVRLLLPVHDRAPVRD